MALLLDGGDGDDIIEGILNNGATAEMFGDLGSDIFRLSGTDYSATVDGGAGDDFFKITMGVSAKSFFRWARAATRSRSCPDDRMRAL